MHERQLLVVVNFKIGAMFFKTQIISIVLLFITLCMSANSIHGKVTDQQNKPLTGASIRIQNSGFGAVTDENGEYSIQKLNGKVLVEVSFVGFKTEIKEVIVAGDEQVNVVLQEAPFVYNDVVVSATRAQNKSPFAYTNISKKELDEKKNGEELPFVLNTSPSVVTFSENGTPFGNTGFRVRGSDPSRVNVTVDGIPLNDAESQAVFWVNMSDFTESVEDIQIQRGVGASTNGAASFGASVNIQTKGYNADAFGEVSTVLGSYNTFKRNAQVNTGLINEHYVFNARLSKLTSDGYMQHSGMDHQSYFMSGGYFSDKTIFQIKLFGNEEHTDISWWGVPDYMLSSDRTYNPAGEYEDKDGIINYYDKQQDNYVQTNLHAHLTQEITEKLKLNAAFHYTWGKGYYQQIQDDGNWLHDADYAYYGFPNTQFIHPESGDTTSASDIARQKWLDNDFYGGTFSLEYNEHFGNIVLGGAANRYDGQHFGKVLWAEFNPGIPVDYEYYRSHSVKDELSMFAKAQINISENWFGYTDLQFRAINYTINGMNGSRNKPDLDMKHSYNFFNPKLGISYLNKEHQAFASFGVANREPTRANYVDAVGDAGAAPLSERLFDTELGYQYTRANLSIKTNLFYMSYKDQLVPTGEKNSVGYDIMTNVEKSYRAGIEVEASYKPISWFKWDLNMTLSDNKIIDFIEYNTAYDADYWNKLDLNVATKRGNTNIAYSPNAIGASILTFYPLKGLSTGLVSKYVGSQYFDNTQQDAAKLNAYFVNDFMISYKLPLKFMDFVEVKFKVNNLFDEDYISNAYGGKDLVQQSEGSTVFDEARWTYYFPQAFRNYLLQLKFRF